MVGKRKIGNKGIQKVGNGRYEQKYWKYERGSVETRKITGNKRGQAIKKWEIVIRKENIESRKWELSSDPQHLQFSVLTLQTDQLLDFTGSSC